MSGPLVALRTGGRLPAADSQERAVPYVVQTLTFV